jgi:4-amino-4-deoxy-L-arabinose transferase-like glycosyltransferase
VVAFIVRIIVLGYNYEILYRGDAIQYLRLGLELSEGKGFIDYKTGLPYAYWPPGWPIVISLFYEIFGQHEFILRIYQTFVSALLCSGVFLLAKEVFNDRVGFFAALYCTLYPTFLHPQFGFVNLLNDPTYHFLLVVGLLFFFKAEKNKYYYLLSGLILGFNALVKPNGLVVPALLITTLLIQLRFRKAFVGSALLLTFGFMMSVLPWTLRNYIVLDRLVLVSTNSGVNMYVGNATTFSNKLRQGDSYYEMIRAQGDGYEQGQILNRRGTEFLFKNIKNHPQKFLKKLKYHFDPFLAYKVKKDNTLETITKYNWMYVILVPFVILGLVSRPTDKFVILSGLFLSINTLTALVYLGAVRYRVTIEPLLIIIGVMGIAKFMDHSSFRYKGLMIWLLINALIGVFFPTEFPRLLMDLIPGSDLL